MNCPLRSEETTDLLLDYSAGRLDHNRAALLERHMDVCSRCAGFRMEQAAVWEALDAWEPALVSMSFNRTLWQKIDALANAPWHTRLAEMLRFHAWKPAFPLAVAVVLIGFGFVFDHPGNQTSVTKSAAAQGVSITDADQVERTLDDIQLLRQLDTTSAGVSGNSKPM